MLCLEYVYIVHVHVYICTYMYAVHLVLILVLKSNFFSYLNLELRNDVLQTFLSKTYIYVHVHVHVTDKGHRILWDNASSA